MVEENIKNILEDYKEETKRHLDVVKNSVNSIFD